MEQAKSRIAIIKKLEMSKPLLAKKGVRKIALFGSYAKGMQKKSSDIDLIIEFEKGQKSFDNYMEAKFLLEKIFRKKIDLVIKGSLKPIIAKSVEGGAIYV